MKVKSESEFLENSLRQKVEWQLLETGKHRDLLFNGYRAAVWDVKKKFYKWRVMVIQQCEGIQCH